MKIRNVTPNDLKELVVIENLCFTKEEAASKEAFEKRIQIIPDSFFVAEEGATLIGLVNGPVINETYIMDELFAEIKANPPMGGHQSILGLAVAPDFQHRGVATALLAHIEKESRSKKRESITLTCKENLIRFYEKQGYINKGVSSSVHGGVVWYNMIKELIITSF